MSSEARERVTELQAEYHDDLLADAADVARRSQADCISQANVDAADAALRTPRTASRGQFWAELGAVLFGAGLGQFYAVMTSPTPNETIGFGFSFVSAVIGVAMLVHFRRR